MIQLSWVHNHILLERICNKAMTPMQEKMIEQVAATMSIENMPLSQACHKNLKAMASGKKTREQVTQEITEKYKKKVLENG